MRTATDSSSEPVFNPHSHEDVFEVVGDPEVVFSLDFSVFVARVRFVYYDGFVRPGQVFVSGFDCFGNSVTNVHLPSNVRPEWLERFIRYRERIMESRGCSV